MKLQTILNTLLVVALIFGGVTLYKGDSFSGNSFSSCTTVTETTVSIGADIATEVLSATSGRSWAMIQMGTNGDVATNTPRVSFGSTATLASGLQLSTSTPSLVFGMDTDHPTSESVSMITDNGSTTARVSECR